MGVNWLTFNYFLDFIFSCESVLMWLNFPKLMYFNYIVVSENITTYNLSFKTILKLCVKQMHYIFNMARYSEALACSGTSSVSS